MKFRMQPFTSLVVTLVFLGLILTGVVLFGAPRGRVGGWMFMGLTRHEWMAVHLNIALLFIVFGALHLWFNWGVLWRYLKERSRLAVNCKFETLAAALFGIVVWAGSAYGVAPFDALFNWNMQIKDAWEAADNLPAAGQRHLGKGGRGEGGTARGGPGQGQNHEAEAGVEEGFGQENAQEFGRGKGRGGSGRGMGWGKGKAQRNAPAAEAPAEPKATSPSELPASSPPPKKDAPDALGPESQAVSQ